MATAQSLVLLSSAGLSQFHFSPTAAASFESRAGQGLQSSGVLCLAISAVAGALVITAFVKHWPMIAGASVLISLSAILIAFAAQADHRRALDPKPELDREMASLDFGPGATVELRTSTALPDFPNVRWSYRVPLSQASACAQARSALEDWVDSGSLTPRSDDPCAFDARRRGGSVNAFVARVPFEEGAVGEVGFAYVLVELSPCLNDPCG